MTPFNITISIEGVLEQLYIIPDLSPGKSPEYKVFDKTTYIGSLWADYNDSGRFWCTEGSMVKELSDQITEQIEAQMPM